MSIMKFGSVVRLLLGVTVALAAAGCDYYPRHPGPPPIHAPYYYDYYYYPHADVYFHIYTGDYYYRDGRDWKRARALPPRIYLDPGDRRQLRIESDRPYTRERRDVPPPANTGPRYKPDPARDRQERQYNKRRYEEYRKKYRN